MFLSWKYYSVDLFKKKHLIENRHWSILATWKAPHREGRASPLAKSLTRSGTSLAAKQEARMPLLLTPRVHKVGGEGGRLLSVSEVKALFFKMSKVISKWWSSSWKETWHLINFSKCWFSNLYVLHFEYWTSISNQIDQRDTSSGIWWSKE